MAIAWNSAWCRLKSANAGKVCGLSHRSTSVAAKATCREAGSDSGRLAAARSARGPLEIPRVRCSSVEAIVRLIRHQELRTVGRSEHDRASLPHPRNNNRICGGGVAPAQEATPLPSGFRPRERGFYPHPETGEPSRRTPRSGSRGGPCTKPLGIEIDQCIELWVQPLDLSNVLLSEFARRYFAGTEQFQHLDSGTQDDVTH